MRLSGEVSSAIPLMSKTLIIVTFAKKKFEFEWLEKVRNASDLCLSSN